MIPRILLLVSVLFAIVSLASFFLGHHNPVGLLGFALNTANAFWIGRDLS